MDVFCHVVENFFLNKDDYSTGVHMMVRGFLTTGWMNALELVGVKNPERKINTLQALVWDTVVDPIWQQRNKLQHATENEYNKKDNV